MAKVTQKKKEKKNITAGVAHVNSTFNNTRITITDAQGNTVSWATAAHRVLKALVSLLLMLLRLLLKMQVKKPWNAVLKLLKLKLKDLVQVVNLLSELCKLSVLQSLLFVMLLRFRTTAAVCANAVAYSRF